MSDVFKTLAAVDCSAHTEKKGNFTYLSWTWAWSLVKSHYPTATFEKVVFHDNQNNPLPFMRDTKGNTYVQTTVTIEGESHSEIYPVLDFKNKAMPFPDSFAVNTALQRCLVKTIAYFGLGLNIYAGEDLPVMDTEESKKEWQANVDRIKDQFGKATSTAQVDDMWRENKVVYDKLPKKDQVVVMEEFKRIKTYLKENEDAA
tara:strand:+ start:1087 stop:1692 length:606 start_codon:yes stop_codon:yes gene_type:complete